MKLFIITAFAALALIAVPALAADTYEVDTSKSKISFKIKNKPPNAAEFQEVTGHFKKFSGTVVFDEETLANSTVEFEVKTVSVDTANEKRDTHLRNQDFFKVKEYPNMTFKSTKVTKTEEGNYKVEGKFTLLDKSKTISIVFVPSGTNGGKTSFQIKRSDYGMTYRVPDTADEVDVTLEITGKKKA